MLRDHEKPTRREMLKRAAGAAGVLLAPWGARVLQAAAPARGFKIGACDWSLRAAAVPGAFQLARQIGLDGVQVSLTTAAQDKDLRRPEVQKAFRAAIEQTGLEIASLSLAQTNQVPLKSDPRAAQWLIDSIDVCERLGVSIVMAPCFGKADLDMSQTREIDHLVEVLRRAAEKAEPKGVVIGLESYLSAEDNLKIIDRVGSAALKVYYDVGNSTDKGRDILKEIRLLGPRICQFHAKDGPHMLGKGRIDFRQVRRAIDQIGYRGWLVIEAAKPHDLIADYQAHCRYLRAIFPRSI